MNRLSIFSSNNRRTKVFSIKRKRLFSSTIEEMNEGGITLRRIKCQDCGNIIESAANVSQILCPKCGGKRFNVIREFKHPDQEPDNKDDIKESKISLFKDKHQEKLKKFSGTTMSADQFQKVFSDKSDYLLEKGFATDDGCGNITISPSAYETEKLFSKLIIQVTKILDLDEGVMSGRLNKEEVIEDLARHNDMPPKAVVIVRKAHGIMPPIENSFCDKDGCECCECENPEEKWIEDSSIISDLSVEYSNQTLDLKQFIKILEDRYPDAPDNIIDLLLKKRVIGINGNSVTINK